MKKRSVKNKIVAVLLSLGVCAGSIGALAACGDKGARISVDFSAVDGTLPQNLKKIDMFNPTWTFMGEADGTLDPAALGTLSGINELKPDNFRIDLMFGNEQNGIGKPIGRNGGSGGSDEEWDLAREFIDACKESGVSPYLAAVGTPAYATKEGDDLDFRNVPDPKRYYEFCYNVADYLKRNGIYATLETWNEPDLEGNVYWLGSTEEWINAVITAAKAYYDANEFSSVVSAGIARPLKFINEPATLGGETTTGWDYFFGTSAARGAMPDGFSWHFYGPSDGDLEGDYTSGTGENNFTYQINEVRKAFERTAKTCDVRKVQQHLTEYHPVSNDFYGGKSQMNDTYERVWAFYDAIERINEASDVTRVSWPMWIASEQFGLFEPYLAVNPVYHALWAYGRLPVNRVKTSGDGNETVGVMAGADSLRAGAIVYNRALKETQTVTIDWKNLPFEAESCTVYGILPDYYVKRLPNKTPEVYLAIKKPKNKGGVTLEIPVNGAYYIEFNTAESKSELDKTANIGQLMKKEYCYTERGDGKPFADVFNGSFAAYLGMLDNDEGEASVAVITSGANKLGKLDFAVETYGELAAGENAALGVRVDYHTADGFVKSVKIAVGGFTSDPELPFGTREKADESHIFGAGGKYSLDLNANAPENWDGIIEISYFIKNAGSGALAKFTAA